MGNLWWICRSRYPSWHLIELLQSFVANTITPICMLGHKQWEVHWFIVWVYEINNCYNTSGSQGLDKTHARGLESCHDASIDVKLDVGGARTGGAFLSKSAPFEGKWVKSPNFECFIQVPNGCKFDSQMWDGKINQKESTAAGFSPPPCSVGLRLNPVIK